MTSCTQHSPLSRMGLEQRLWILGQHVDVLGGSLIPIQGPLMAIVDPGSGSRSWGLFVGEFFPLEPSHYGLLFHPLECHERRWGTRSAG